MNGWVDPPCKDCTKRHPHCHGECDEYAIFKAKKQIAYNQAERRAQNRYKSAHKEAAMRVIWNAQKRNR